MAGRNSDKTPWADIAYNFLVHEDAAFEGRGWDHKNAANGDAVNNGKFVAICVLIGEGNEFSQAAKDTLDALMAIGRNNHGVGFETWPHSHFFQTQCPGDDIRAWITAGEPSPTTEPQVPTVPQEDDMSVEFTIVWPDGTKTIGNPGGGILNGNNPFFGAFGNLRDDEKLDWVTPYSLEPVDLNNKDAGYRYWVLGHKNEKHEFKFDQQFANSHKV